VGLSLTVMQTMIMKRQLTGMHSFLWFFLCLTFNSFHRLLCQHRCVCRSLYGLALKILPQRLISSNSKSLVRLPCTPLLFKVSHLCVLSNTVNLTVLLFSPRVFGPDRRVLDRGSCLSRVI
jgi:hypothetical protein